MAEMDRFVLSIICLSSLLDYVFFSAVTSTKADDKERMTASQSEHKNEIKSIIINENKIDNIWRCNAITFSFELSSSNS